MEPYTRKRFKLDLDVWEYNLLKMVLRMDDGFKGAWIILSAHKAWKNRYHQIKDRLLDKFGIDRYDHT